MKWIGRIDPEPFVRMHGERYRHVIESVIAEISARAAISRSLIDPSFDVENHIREAIRAKQRYDSRMHLILEKHHG